MIEAVNKPAANQGYLIEARGLSVRFRQRAILDRIDLRTEIDPEFANEN